MEIIKMISGIVAISVGLPLVAVPIYSISFQKTDKTIEDFKERPIKTILPFYDLGIFMEGLSDLQETKDGLKPLVMMLVIGILCCIAGYYLLTS